jgi:hypothetical protein
LPAARSRRLGDAVGLTQFGVNVSRIKAHSKSALRHWHESEDEFIYMLEGELVLHEDAGETCSSRRRCRLARQRRHRPLPDQPYRQGRALSRGRYPLQDERVHYPMSISAWSATTRAAAGCASPASRSRNNAASAAERAMADNFKLDIDADGIALITWDMPGRSMNVIDLAVIEELSGIVEKSPQTLAIKGAVSPRARRRSAPAPT